MNEPQHLPYTAVTDIYGEVALRPLLSLTLSLKGKTVKATGLLDSGADINVLPYSLGLQLGAEWERQSPLSQLSGNLSRHEARGVVLNAQVSGFDQVRLAFAWTRDDNVPLILGQVNFFQEFAVCFFRAQGVFELGPKRL